MKIVKVSSLVLLSAIGLSFLSIAPAQAGTVDHTIAICHANEGAKGYTNPTVDYSSIVNLSDGTVVRNGHATHQNGQDIIPAFNWLDHGTRFYFDGQNLDKAALLDNGCVAPATPAPVTPVPPTYVPASCMDPKALEHPYGTVIVPADLGEGVKSATIPTLNADKTIWNVTYTLKDNNSESTFAWPVDQTGIYNSTVVPLTSDPNWITDSKTGKAGCELPNTGASEDLMLYGGLGGGALVLGVLLMLGMKLSRKRTDA